jgi:hypothetical protein
MPLGLSSRTATDTEVFTETVLGSNESYCHLNADSLLNLAIEPEPIVINDCATPASGKADRRS